MTQWLRTLNAPGTWEAEAGGFLSSRPAWSRKTKTKKKKQKQKQKPTNAVARIGFLHIQTGKHVCIQNNKIEISFLNY